MDWIALLQTFGGILAGMGLGIFTKSGRRRDKADADRKVAEAQRQMIDNYEERIKDLHDNIDRLNAAEKSYIERIAEQNKALTSKTDLIRDTNQKLWESEQEKSRAQERNIALTKEVAHLKDWKCVRPYKDCQNREPKQKVKHERYTPLNSEEP